MLDRRAVLRLAGGAAAAVGLAACGPFSRTSGSTSTKAVGGSPGEAFAGPRELSSRDGLLEVTLVAAATLVPWGTGSRYALTYNGTTPGPTLRARPGDLIRLTLRNQLDRPTNLHTHGLHVSPSGTSDNVFVMVEPGSEVVYEYHLPTDHPSGTFWYHPHHHGEVATQVAGGMAGAIVIEDEIDHGAEMAATTERVLVLADPRIGTGPSVLTASPAERQQGREGDAVLVNGTLRPRLAGAAGTVERWRIVNASASRYYRLTLPGLSMHLIASDHGRLERPLAVKEVLLTPGQRAEVLVPLDHVGSFTLSTAAVNRGSMGMGGGMGGGGGSGSSSGAAELLSLEVGAAGTDTNAPALPAALRPLDDLSTAPVDRSRTLTLGAMGMGGGTFVIDGRSFEPTRIDTTCRLGTTEEWTLRNNSMMDHPFHLHVWPFQVVARSDGAPRDPGWRDTVNVPAGRSVKVRVRFTDYAGKAVYHCHILDHEDLGMMGIIDVQ